MAINTFGGENLSEVEQEICSCSKSEGDSLRLIADEAEYKLTGFELQKEKSGVVELLHM